MNRIPAEHLVRLQACSDDDLRKVRDHNQARASSDWADGRYDEARRWYAYVDMCQEILDERHYGVRPAAVEQQATVRQVDYIAKLLIRRDVESGFSGLVAGLHANGRPDLDAIRRLTKTQASEVIDSLTEQY